MKDVHWAIVGLAAVVTVATVVGWSIGRRYPDSVVVTNLNERIRSWWLLILIGSAGLIGGPYALLLLFALASFLALQEFTTRTRLRQTDRLGWLTCLMVVLPLQYVWIGLSAFLPFLVWVPLCGFVVLPTLTCLSTESAGFLNRSGSMLSALMFCVYGISHVPALMLVRTDRPELLMLFVVVIAQASDVLQYVWGTLFGKHRVLPSISPNKTIEGLIGGVLSATALGACLSPITPFSPKEASAMAGIIAIFGFLGGVVLSTIKRDLAIKDWSGLIGGHGGMLDRIDSLCFSAPIFFYLAKHYCG